MDFIHANDPSCPAYREVSETWAAYCARNGGTGTDITSLEMTMLASNGAVGNNLRDLWGSYLDKSGATGTFKQQLRGFVNALGLMTPQ